MTLGVGLYELTVEARGQGELLLGISDAGERSQMLADKWGTYGYLFEAASGTKTVTIRAVREGTVTAAAIRPATDRAEGRLAKGGRHLSTIWAVHLFCGAAPHPAAQVGIPGRSETAFRDDEACGAR